MADARFVICAALIAVASPVFGQDIDTPKFAAVNVAYVARTSAFGKTALARIEAEARKREVEVSAKSLEIQKQQTELQGLGLTDRSRADLQRAFDRARVDFDRLREDAQRELQGMQAQFESDFRVKLGPVVDEIAKEKGYHFVFNIDDNPLIAWFAPAADISDEVVKRLDARR